MKAILIFGTALFLLMGCSTVKIKADYAKGTDFSQFKSYRWISRIEVNRDDELSKHPRFLKRVQDSINKTLDSKGFNMVNKILKTFPPNS